MARGLSKKAKAEAYDGLSREADLMRLLLHDIGTDVKPDAVVKHSEPDPLGSGDTVYCRARAWRLTGAAGGIVLLTIWTIDDEGDKSIDNTRAMYVDDMHRMHFGRSAWERSIGGCGSRLTTARREMYESLK